MTLERVRLTLVGGYVAAVLLAAGWESGPRLIWTVVIAALPLFFVIGGFHLWRRICPLAWFSQLPIHFGRGGTRKVSGRVAEHPLAVPFGLMLVALSLRLLAINGSPWMLAGFLVLVPAVAAGVGLVYRGKTWCNYICPVGLVERVYTEPTRLIDGGNSQCSPCSACTARCPDIDVEQGYWKTGPSPSRRAVWFAWPGVVLAFYVHYALQAGDWSWYFDGGWAYETDQASKWLEAGYSFASLPRLLAAPLTLVAGGALSFGLFSAAEGAARRRVGDDEGAAKTVQHRALAVAGFVAFNAFYFFAGQPTLLAGPVWLQRLAAFLVISASTWMLVRRWSRSEADFVQQRFARRLAKRWKWDASDKDRSAPELVVIHDERTRARKERLEAYSKTLGELAAEGTVTREGLSLLATVRGQLGISDSDHDGIVKRLEAGRQDLFDEDRAGDRATDLQHAQYRRGLERIVELAADAGRLIDDRAVHRLRLDYGIEPEEHAAVLATLLHPETVLARRVAAEGQRLVELGDIARLASSEVADCPDEAAFVVLACRWAGRPVAESLRGILAATGDAGAVAADEGLRSDDPTTRAVAAEAWATDPQEKSLEQAATDRDQHVAIAAGELLRSLGQTVPTGAPTRPSALDAALRLRGVALFSGLGPGDLLRIAAVVIERSVVQDEVLCTQGDAGDEVFLVVRGALKAFVDGADVGVFGPGEALGELAVLSPAPRAATVLGVEDSAVLALDGAVFRDLLKDHPTVSEGILRQLARRLQGPSGG